MKEFLKKIKIEKKILIIFSSLLAITQIFVAMIAYLNIYKINKSSKTEMENLSSNVTETGESLIQDQIEKYLSSISYSVSENLNSLFKEINNDSIAISNSMKYIYENKNNFVGEIPPLPEFNMSEESSKGITAYHKAYAVDNNNRSENPMVYNVSEYSKYSKNIFKTSPSNWSETSEEEKNNILDKYSVVSNNNIPNKLYTELLTLSNAQYILGPILNANPYISSICIGTESGLFYEYSADNSHRRIDPRLRDWYISAKNSSYYGNSQPVWQSTYISSSTGKLCITCSKSFNDSNNDILGVCAIDISLDNIHSFMKKSKIDDDSYNLILSENGTIIIKSDNKTNSLNIKNISMSKEIIDKINLQKSGILTLNIDNKDYYAGYNSLANPSWSVCSIMPKEQALEPVSKIHNIIDESKNNSENSISQNYLLIILQFFIEFFLCAFVTYFIALKLSRTISKPIVELSKKTKNIGKGDFSTDISIDYEDEVGELAQSFNVMIKDLKLYMENLETTVAEKEKIHNELLIAKKIQRSMMPYIFPAYPNRDDIDIYALVDPAREVGGDFYDFFFIDDKHLALVIADVSDKGISAALFMVIAKILIKNQLQNGDTPSEILKIINNRLQENNDAGMFVTCFLGILDTETGKLVYANAGHNPPILYRNSDKSCIYIDKPHGFILGGVSDLKYTQNEINLYPEDVLLMYTDGVTEAMNLQGELFSNDRLKKVFLDSMNKHDDVNDVVKNIRDEIERFSNGAERADDITILAFKNLNITPTKKDKNSATD